ncbi:MAG: DUF1203 domain-containing protein [Rhizobiales bacterium]|nr:DUF1203 domain-containing protein [Hyphomicrobiales bacterium]
MTAIKYAAMPTHEARSFQTGAADAYGRVPERRISGGSGVLCRHCLRDVGEGEPYLILAYRPFADLQPYAETGPIFLHAEPCERAAVQSETPAMLLKRAAHLIKGYGADDRIVYGTGKIVTSPELSSSAAAILDRSDVAYVHVRSSVNNCYTCRIDRA